MGRPRVIVAAFVVVAVVGSLLVMVLGDDAAVPGASGVVSTRSLPRPADVVWSTEGDLPTRAHVAGALVDGEVVVVTSSGGHHGFDPDGGDLRWRLPLELAGQRVVVGGGLLVGSLHGSVVAFEVRDGTRTWAWQGAGGSADEHGAAPVLVAHGEVFVVTAPDVLVALDADTGSRSWRLPVRIELDASLTGIVGHGPDLLYVRVSRPPGSGGPTVTQHVAAIDPGTSQVRWEIDAPLGALVDGDRLLVPQSDGQVHMADASSGEFLRSVQLPLVPPAQPERRGVGHPVSLDVVDWMHVHDGVLLSVVDGQMAAVSVATGQTLWTVQLPDPDGRLISADARAAYVATPSMLVAIDLDDGTLEEIDRRVDGAGGGRIGGPGGIIVEIDGRDATVTLRSGSQVRWSNTVVTPTPVRPQAAGSVGVAFPVHAAVEVLHAGDGAILWESPAVQRGPPVTPVAAVGRQVFVLRPVQDDDASGPGWMELVAVDADSGEPTWIQQLDEGLLATSDLVASGDSVFLGTATGVSAYSADDGRSRFVLSTDGLRIRTSGAVTDLAATADTVAFVIGPAPFRGSLGDPTDASQRLKGDERLLVVADVTTGDVRWQQRLAACGRLATTADAILVPTTTGMSSLDPADGAVQWASRVSRPSCWSPVASAGTVATVDDTSTISGLDVATGTRTWTTQLDRPVSAQPTIAGGGLLVPTGDRLVEIDLGDGAIRWQTDVPHRIDAPPTVVGDTLVIVSATGQGSALR